MNSEPAAAWWPLLWHSEAVCLAVLGPDRRYEQVNEALCSLLAADAATLCGWSYERLGHSLDLDIELDAFARLAAGAPVVAYSRRFCTARGDERQAMVQVIAQVDGRFLQLITPTILAIKTEAPESARRLADLAVALGHDAQQPVRQLGVTAGLLGERLRDLLAGRERERVLLENMVSQAAILGRQWRSLVQYAQIGAPMIDPAPWALHALVEDALAHVVVPIGLAVRNAVPAQVRLHCDRAQVTTALIELLRNACAAQVEGRTSVVTVAAVQDPGTCVLTVTDEGLGIAPEARASLFKLLSAHGPAAGAGVGLAVVRAIVAGHRGQIEIDSVPGSGTTVRLTLPE